ncbi:MAG: hypothetical protein PHR92_01100 [Lachnospiraceae bacterium]|nr:hypothetical protein [Lachnospiraceae bacterium]
METKVFTEENGVYCLDCRKALWAEGNLHDKYRCIKNVIADVDFIFEDDRNIYLMEYKNASAPNAVNPSAFNPLSGGKIENVSRKFYDSLHYLMIQNKGKPKKYVYVLQYPNGDATSRRMVRNKLKERLPFQMQKKNKKLIESVEVLSIKEWNEHLIYKDYPLIKVEEYSETAAEAPDETEE